MDRLDILTISFVILILVAIARDEFEQHRKRQANRPHQQKGIAHILANAKDFEL